MRSITCVAAAVAILTSGTAFAQDVILPQAGEDITDWVRWMKDEIVGGGTPAMQLFLKKDASAFKKTGRAPSYPNNDHPWRYTTTSENLIGTLLSPVSGHVPYGNTDLKVLNANANKYRKGNTTILRLNGKVIARVKHNGRYVVRANVKAKLTPGKNVLEMEQVHPSGDRADPSSFQTGRMFEINYKPPQQRQSRSRRAPARRRRGT